MKARCFFKSMAFASLILFLGCVSASAADFFNTSTAPKPLSIGVRFGITSSTQGINLNKLYSDTKKGYTEWGTGFEAGAVVNLNIRDYLTLQPGFFFQNRSYDYTIISANMSTGTLADRFGHTRSYYFQIPVLASFRFNLSDDVRWHIDLGPYFAFGLGGKNKMETFATVVGDPVIVENKQYERDFFTDSDGNMIGMKTYDWGIKWGTAFTFKNHYYFGIHYSMGFRNLANNHANFLKDPSAKNKSWTFTLGYDF